MKILAFSDWRVQSVDSIFQFVEKIEPVDFILYAGDDIGRFEEEGINYFSELSNYTKSGKILAVIGNDDFYLQKNVLKAKGVHNLYDRSYFVNNFMFIGLEASTSGPALFRHTEEDFEKHLNRQLKNSKGKRIIILSHTPPFGFLDRGIRFAEMNKFTHHIGSKALTNFIENHPVDLVICGHCHSQGGMMDKKGSTTIVNVSSQDTRGSKGNFAIIEFTDEGNVNVDWHDTFEILESSSLMSIYGVGPVRAEKFRKAGIKKIVQLANYENLSQLVPLIGLSENSLQLLQLKAKSILNNEIYQLKDFQLNCEKIIFLDIETDIACKRVWLIGFQKNCEFQRLYADNWEQEKDILEKFNEILMDCPGYTLVSFSGTNFDHRIIEEAMQRHKIDADVFLSHPHIDLSILLRRCFIFPNQRFALKELGKFLGYPFAHPDLDGLAVALSYHKHAEDGKPLEPKIFRYNEDDVRSLPFLIDKVTKGELEIKKIFVSNQMGINQTEKKVARDQEFKIASNNIEDYKCPKCGHFHSSKFIKRKLPKQCYRCRYKFNEKRPH